MYSNGAAMLARPMKAVVASGGKNQDFPIACAALSLNICCANEWRGKCTDNIFEANCWHFFVSDPILKYELLTFSKQTHFKYLRQSKVIYDVSCKTHESICQSIYCIKIV